MTETIFSRGKLFGLVHLPQPDGQSLEAGEQVEAVEWFSFQAVEQMVLRGDMQEERIALILLQWLRSQGNENKSH